MRYFTLLLLASLLAGCSYFRTCASETCCSDDDCLMAANYRAVDSLLAAIPPTRRIPKERPVVVATLVNIDNLTSSRLGRTLSEQLATRLTRSGYKIVELKLRESIFVRQGEGELMLSREVKDIVRSHDAQAVLVGTYAESRGRVYVTIKLVGAADGFVISAQDYVLPIDANVRALLWGNTKQEW
jgi:TolB-like protein